jgi:hypothetical protein
VWRLYRHNLNVSFFRKGKEMKRKMKLSLVIVALLGLLALGGPALGSDANLVAHWQFDEGSGTIAYDSVGGNVGTIYGDGEWAGGQVGGALRLDGDGDYVDCGNSFASVTGSVTKSIMAWVKSDTTNYTACAMILELYRKSDSSSGFYIKACDNPGTWQSFHINSGSYTRLDSGVYVTDEWTHIALVQDGPEVDLYVNGVSEASASDGVAPGISSPRNATIGAYVYDSSAFACFSGTIDEVRIYNRALSGEEVQQLYLEGFSLSAAAIRDIEDAIAEKLEALETIDAALEKEWAAYDALEELLAGGDYEGLSKRDIAAAQRKMESAIRRQERSKRVVAGSIEELEDALLSLGLEPAPEPNLPEPNEPSIPVPGKRLKVFRGQR